MTGLPFEGQFGRWGDMEKMEALRLIYASAIMVMSAMLACVIYPPLARTANKIVEILTR